MAFKVAARTVLELGAELISSDAIALYELVKNAYDARSKRATIAITTVFKYSQLRDALKRIDAARLRVAKKDADEADLTREIRQQILSDIDPTADASVQGAFAAEIIDDGDLSLLSTSLNAAFDRYNVIEIIDGGLGMSLDRLGDVFLTIGTRSRLEPSDEGHRFVGGKGLGRLSAMRLGDELKVTTSTKTDTFWNVLRIDWRAFRHDSAETLDKIRLTPLRGAKKTVPTSQGTTIRINALKSDWDWERAKRLADHYFDRLFDPFHGQARYPLIIQVNNRDVPIPTFDRDVFAAALARGTILYENVGDDGPCLRFTIDYITHNRTKTEVWNRSDILGLTSKEDISVAALETLGPFKADFHWFNRQRIKNIEGVGTREAIKDTVNHWANGLMMYRDGLRVNPYGNPDDDWLGIDSRALSSSGYKVSRKQLIGAVYISADENPQLIDQTNREGLRTNEEKTLLVILLQKALTENFKNFLNAVESEIKKSARVSSVQMTTHVAAATKRFRDNLAVLKQVVPSDKQTGLTEIETTFGEMEKRLEDARDSLGTAERQHRDLVDLAGVGLQIEIVAHELGRITRQTLDTLAGIDRKEIPKPLAAAFKVVESQMRVMRKRLEALDPLGPNSRNRAEKVDLCALARDILEGHSDRFARLGIHSELDLGGNTERPFIVRAVRGMIVQVLENLIDNSIFWLSQQKRADPSFKPRIRLEVDSSSSELRLTDNGPGIAVERAEEVFRPFVTFKPPGQGKGLGLYISREIATRHSGDLFLLDNPDAGGRLHTFILSISGH